MTLDDWALATITGPDGEKYLQGQITADVSHLTADQHLLAAHRDAKGKMWSNLRVFHRDGGFAWIERRSLREAQLTELKKICCLLQSHHRRKRRSGPAGRCRFPGARRAGSIVRRAAGCR